MERLVFNTETIVKEMAYGNSKIRSITIGKDVKVIEAEAFAFTCLDTVEIKDIDAFFEIRFGNYYSCPAIWVKNVVTAAGERIRHIDEFPAYKEWLDYYRLEYGDDEFKDFYENEAREVLILSIAEDPSFAKDNGFDLTENELKLISLEVELSKITFCGCRFAVPGTEKHYCSIMEQECNHKECGSKNCPILNASIHTIK